MRSVRVGVVAGLVAVAGAAAGAEPQKAASGLQGITEAERLGYLKRAQVWRATDIPAMDLLTGPPGGFTAHQDVACDYVQPAVKPSGRSPKFECALRPGDVVKVKYRENNGEVYAEVAATRLFWALGFGADAVYQVRVTCRGCPKDPWDKTEPRLPSVVFEHAAIERKMPGQIIEHDLDEGFGFSEIDLMDPAQGGATRDQREALRLLAAFVQHSDSKPSNQRLLCLPEGVSKNAPPGERCTAPFVMVQDLGITFGKGNMMHGPTDGSANYHEWSEEPLWRKADTCEAPLRGNLDHSTLDDPVVTEGGRRFLAGLLRQLSDKQIHDMFDAASMDQRGWSSEKDKTKNGTLDQWVAAFKKKRSELDGHVCAR